MTAKLGRPIRQIKARAQDLHIVLPGEDKNTKRWARLTSIHEHVNTHVTQACLNEPVESQGVLKALVAGSSSMTGLFSYLICGST